MSALFEVPGLNVYLQIIVTILSIAVHLFATRSRERQETTLKLIAIYTIGLSGWFSIASGFFGHLLYADVVAQDIGWPLNSGFQMELGFAAIGIGLVGFFGFWNRSFWLPFILAKTIFMWGAGFTHILHMVQYNNFSPSNTGAIVYYDFLLPVILIVLYALYRRERQQIQALT